jgi:nitrogen regulatory protein PII
MIALVRPEDAKKVTAALEKAGAKRAIITTVQSE